MQLELGIWKPFLQGPRDTYVHKAFQFPRALWTFSDCFLCARCGWS